MIDARRFTPAGVAAFQTFLDSCTTSTPRPHPVTALNDPVFSEPLEGDVSLEDRELETRFSLAEYLNQRFEESNYLPSRTDTGLWTWIACFYFPRICPQAGGQLRPGAAARWILQGGDWRRYYRHLVAGPYSIYRAHIDNPKRALALLCQKPGRPGDLVEQLASRQEIVTNRALMSFATEWFVEPSTGMQRRVANSKGPGGARRFAAILAQFDVTWDLSMLSEDGLKSIMPNEFRLAGEVA